LSATDMHDQENVELLPPNLRDLIARSQKLYAKVRRLDATIHSQATGEKPVATNPVGHQLGLLKAAFGTGNIAQLVRD